MFEGVGENFGANQDHEQRDKKNADGHVWNSLFNDLIKFSD
jgi:hypothetical protein